ncbi:MAG: SH3 domain-containing protein [Sphingobacteriales bacterium]|nr:SH3 domain-containing protein [Sphingobacteriales bacterium]
MRRYLFLAMMFVSLHPVAQPGLTGPYYVAAKNGLSLREKKDAQSKLLATIPYATKLTVTYPDEIVNITLEGIESAWAKTTFNGKTGYIVNTYLLPWPPPKATIKTMKQYLPQVSAVAGAPVVIKANIESLESGGANLKKQLFKNGAEYHEETFYEANNDSYFLPGFTLQQGFVLARLIPEFKDVFSADEAFPSESKTFTKNGHEYRLIVDAEKIGDYTWINKISIEYEDGAIYSFQMFLLGGQLVISFGGGV